MGQAKIPKELIGRMFSAQEATKKGLTFYALRKMLQEGSVNKIARGIYQTSQNDFSEEQTFTAASLRIGRPSAVCLVSALTHYQLTDAIPKKVWIMVKASKRTQYKNIRLLRTRNPHWNIGIEKQEGYWITSIERTLVDAIIYRNLIGTNLAMEALKKATKNSQTTLGYLVEMSKKLGIYHRTRPYLEALA